MYKSLKRNGKFGESQGDWHVDGEATSRGGVGCRLSQLLNYYPLVICYISMVEPWPIEIDGLPNLKMVDLSMANC